MSILSDKEIYQLSVEPDYHHIVLPYQYWEGINHPLDMEQVKKSSEAGNPLYCQGGYNFKPMIEPFVKESVKTMETDQGTQRILSYGLSSYGYDIRLAKEDLKVFTNINSAIVDPRKVDPTCYTAPLLRVDEDGLEYVLQPPNSLMLGHTMEWFNIPRDILATCLGKSTYARVGVSLIVTPLEPEWSGNLVVEIVNHTNSPVKIYPGQGIGQLTFHKASSTCLVSYGDRGGKYQGQSGTTDAKV